MPKSLSKTPAPKKDRIFGSDKNKKGSASSRASAKGIDLNDSIIETLSNKAKEYNEKHPNSKVSVTTLKAVMRRGMGAYSTSHRPTITGGAPNSRQAWGFARVNKFLKKKAGQQVKAAYVQDDDLMEKGGFIAPNGKTSNLTPEQYKLVRTPEFKAWFGDWENDPENSSKVLDENGEPKVVYHGSRYGGINVFDYNQSLRESSGLKEYGNFFTDNTWVAELYRNSGKYTKEVDAQRIKEISKLESLLENVRTNREYDLINKEIDKWYSKTYEVFLNLRKVKEFDAEFGANVSGYQKLEVDAGYKIATGGDAISFLKEGRFGVEKVDGIIAHNIVEMMQKTSDWEKYIGTSYLVFEPQNIKLADGTNKTFDMNNPDIRYADGGNLKEFKIDGKDATFEDFKNLYLRESVEFRTFDLTPKKVEYFGDNEQNIRYVKEYNYIISPFRKDGLLKDNYMKAKVLETYLNVPFRTFASSFRKHIDPYFKASNRELKKGRTFNDVASYVINDGGYYIDESKYRAFAKDFNIEIPTNDSYADGGETKKSKDAYTIVGVYRDPKTNDYRESEDLTQDGLIGYKLRYNKAPNQYYGYVGYDNTESELERAKRDLERYNKQAEEEKERKKLKDIENKIKREKQKIIDAQKLEAAKSDDSAKPAYLMTISEYQDRVVPLLKEYEKFARKNSEYLSDTSYSGFYKVTFEQVVSRGLEGKKTGYYFRRDNEKELIEDWNERKFRKYDDKTIPKPTPKDVLEKNISFFNDLNKFFDEKIIFDGLKSEYKKSNKTEIRRAIEDDTYKKILENGEITEEQVIKIAEEHGIKVPKRVFSQESNLKKEAKKQMDEILSKIPKMNKDVFDSLYNQLFKDFEDVEKIVFEREKERYEGLIKECIELSKKEGGINEDKLQSSISFWKLIFKESKSIAIYGKDSRGYPTSQYFQKNLELKSDYKPVMDKIILDYAESLKYRFLKSVLENFPKVSKPITNIEKKKIDLGVKGFEGRYRFSFADGSYFDFVTEAIPAAGYNIVAFHYRYLTHLENATLADGTKVKGYYEIMDKFSSESMAHGGQTGQAITCVNCGWHWNTDDSDESDKYICHKCGFDNRTFYDPEPIGVMADGGRVLPKLTQKELEFLKNWMSKSDSVLRKFMGSDEIKMANMLVKKGYMAKGISDEMMGSVMYYIDLSRKEREMIENNPDIRYADGGLIAPNGKPSNLTPEQYKLVRTPEFKAWFGDWENDPENASKVLDENGEPLVVYRGMPKKRRVGNVFRYNVNLWGTKGVGGRQTNKFAFYFTDIKEVAKGYVEDITEEEGGYVIKPYFLNIRKLFTAFSKKNQYETTFKELYDLANTSGEPVYYKDYRGNIETDYKGNKLEVWNHDWHWGRKYNDKFRTQEATFSFFVDWNKDQSNQYFWRVYLEDYLKYNGLVFYETTNNGIREKLGDELTPEFGDEFSKTYGVFEPNNIKLADGTNTTFDASNPDIRYADGGVLGVLSTENLIELVRKERENKIKEWNRLGYRVVVARNDGYSYEKESERDTEFIDAKNPSERKVADIIKNNPDVLEIGFNGTIKVGKRVGEELEIADDFSVVLWKKDDSFFKEGLKFEFVQDGGKYINTIVNKNDTITYKDRQDDGKYVYFKQLDVKYNTESESRSKKDILKEEFDNKEAIFIKDKYADGGVMGQELFKPSKTIEQIAKEKDVPLDYAEEQLRKGMKTESEHSDNPMVQETIALQHLDEMIDYYEKLEYMESKNKMAEGGVTKFYKEYLDWYKDGVFNEMTIMVSVPNSFSKMSSGENDLILDVFEKKDESVNAKEKMKELLEIVDRNGLDIYLEPIPRLYNIKDKAKREKITREYLIKYYEKFGFELLSNGFMVRKHNKMEKGGYYKAGGEINPDNKAVKDYFSHGSGNVGGVLVGKRHSEGGIKAVNKSTNQPLEMEGGEVVITRNAVSDNTKREFNGEMLTNREILSKINESGGGVSFADGGDIPETISTSGKEYKYGGKMMKDHEIVSSCGCNHSMADGGIIKPEKPIEKMTKIEVMNFINKIEPTKFFYPRDTISARVIAERKYQEYLSKKNMAEGGETDYHTEIKNHLFPKVDVEVEPEMDLMPINEHYVTADDLGLSDGMPMLAVGTIVYSSGGNDQWEVVSFSDDGVNLVNNPKSPLQSKMEDKHLTFDELIKYFKDKAISIKNISTERELEPAIALVKNKLPQKSFAVGGLIDGDEDEDAKIMQSQFGKSNFK